MNILFMGTDEFAEPSLEKLADVHNVVAVVTRPDKPKGRGRKLLPPPVKVAAEKLNIPVFQPKNLKGKEFKSNMEKLNFDLVVAVAYGRLIPPGFIEKPEKGCICLHPSLLPEYRGCSPIESAIKDGKEKTGLSVFYISNQFDTGDMIYLEEVDIKPDDTGGSLRKSLSLDSPAAILKAIEIIEKGDITPIPQDPEKATYAPKIEKEDALIDWTKSAGIIRNMSRAYNPKPGAFTYFRKKILKVLKAEVLKGDSDKNPGTIDSIEKKQGIVVSCGKDRLMLTEIQPPGKKPMPAWSYVVGHNPQVGEVFEISD
ncbi:MAG: methionyl-tRNA formyltransferase [Candidatus Eremiobacteraeota bacterium]|nr:methionyl-tRNA formyltransferase [Candidatus Eremiobacteraeota bacterium]